MVRDLLPVIRMGVLDMEHMWILNDNMFELNVYDEAGMARYVACVYYSEHYEGYRVLYWDGKSSWNHHVEKTFLCLGDAKRFCETCCRLAGWKLGKEIKDDDAAL